MSEQAPELRRLVIGMLEELENPGCREFSIGEGNWPFKGFVVRQDEQVFAYQNHCRHAGHSLNWKPDDFLTRDCSSIICASHGALYDIQSGECTAGPCAGQYLNRVEAMVENGKVIVVSPDRQT